MKSLTHLALIGILTSQIALANQSQTLPPFFSFEGLAARFDLCKATLMRSPPKPELLKSALTPSVADSITDSVTKALQTFGTNRSGNPFIAWELRNYILSRNSQNLWNQNHEAVENELKLSLEILRVLNPELWARTLFDFRVQSRPWSTMQSPIGFPYLKDFRYEVADLKRLIHEVLLPSAQFQINSKALVSSVPVEALERQYFDQTLLVLIEIQKISESLVEVKSTPHLTLDPAEIDFLKTLVQTCQKYLKNSGATQYSEKSIKAQKKLLAEVYTWLGRAQLELASQTTFLRPLLAPALNPYRIFPPSLQFAAAGMILHFRPEYIEYIAGDAQLANRTKSARGQWKLYRSLYDGVAVLTVFEKEFESDVPRMRLDIHLKSKTSETESFTTAYYEQTIDQAQAQLHFSAAQRLSNSGKSAGSPLRAFISAEFGSPNGESAAFRFRVESALAEPTSESGRIDPHKIDQSHQIFMWVASYLPDYFVRRSP